MRAFGSFTRGAVPVALWFTLCLAPSAPAFGQASDGRESGKEDGARRDAAIARLRATRVSVEWENAALRECLDHLAIVASVNFVVHPKVNAGAPEELRVTMSLRDVTCGAALRLLADLHALKCFWQHGVFMVAPRDLDVEEVVAITYDTRDLVMPITDFPGPVIDIAPRGDNQGGARFTPPEEPKPAPTLDDLITLIKTVTGDQAWTERATITKWNGMLIINQTREMHLKIAEVLGMLRGNR